MQSWMVLTLLIGGYLIYLLLGAWVVSSIEAPYEGKLRKELKQLKQMFLNESPCVNESGLEAFLERVISANKYGVSVLFNASGDSKWDMASSLFFASTLVTTVGYGYTTPLTDSGKAFCIFYALVGVPFTLLLLSAAVQRLMATFTYRPIHYFQFHKGFDRKKVTIVHIVVLSLLVLILFLIIPAAIFNAIESSWSFLDAFYFCFISLCTIGLGDYVPGEQNNQWLRQLYKVSVACKMVDRFTSPEFLAQFIDLYKQMPCLWKVKSKEYSNRNKRQEALNKLVELCKPICSSADLNYVRNKIANLRTVFKRELNKIHDSQRSGAGADDIYVPRLWYFESLRFLTEQVDARSSICTLPSTSSTLLSTSADLDQMSPVMQFEDSEDIPQTQTTTQANESQDDLNVSTPNTPVTTSITSMSTLSTPVTRPQKRRRLEDATTSFLTKASAALQKKTDVFDALGIITADKMRSMSGEQRQIAEMLMLEMLNKGVRGELTSKTIITESDSSPSTQHVAHGSNRPGAQWQYMQPERQHPPWSQDFHYTQL